MGRVTPINLEGPGQPAGAFIVDHPTLRGCVTFGATITVRWSRVVSRNSYRFCIDPEPGKTYLCLSILRSFKWVCGNNGNDLTSLARPVGPDARKHLWLVALDGAGERIYNGH